MLTKIWSFVKHHPVPLVALLGLVSGAAIYWGSHQPEAAQWLWLAALVIGGAPLVWRTLRGLLHGEFAADVVAMLAIMTAMVMGEYFAGLVVVLMQGGGEALERYGLRRASSSLERLLAQAPRSARRYVDGHMEEVEVAAVRVGDLLVVRPGDLVPVDGTLLSPQASVDEAALTGEPLSHEKQQGDRLLSGSINVGGAFEMRAEKLGEESQYARIVRLVRQAQAEKPPIQRLADRYATWFTPLVLLVCGMGWSITADPRTILAVLVVATPCPLILATPVAVISGINRAARIGIIVKGGAAIEQIGRAQAVVFDKTGTLTVGTPTVEHVVSLNGFTPQELLHQAGSVEQLSSHVLGQALAQSAQEHYDVLPVPTNFVEIPGGGVEAELAGRHIVVGSSRFLAQRIGTEHLQRMKADTTVHGDALATFIAIDRQPSGIVFFSDRLRPGVAAVIERLRKLGVQRIIMLTGDSQENAQLVAHVAGIDQFEAGLLPHDKVRIVRELKRAHEPLMMVGDGINDAPALATATVGVAMGAHGTGISAEAADIVLLVDDITKVGDAVAIGQRMLRIAKQSIYIGLGLSLTFMVIASFGLIPPAVGALIQEAIDVAVILNALRAR